jgi:hypothetical protein
MNTGSDYYFDRTGSMPSKKSSLFSIIGGATKTTMRMEAPRRIWFGRRSGDLLYHSKSRLGSVDVAPKSALARLRDLLQIGE